LSNFRLNHTVSNMGWGAVTGARKAARGQTISTSAPSPGVLELRNDSVAPERSSSV
jgi:hypothetical protein